MFIKKLFKNTLIFALGNMFSKVLIILLLPLLTSYYSSREFGYIDLFTTFLSLFIYVIGFNSTEYLLKEVSESKEDLYTTKISTAVLQVTLVSGCLFILIGMVFYYLDYEIAFYITLASILQVVDNLFKQLHRALDNNIVFVTSEIIYSIIFALLALIFIKFKFEYQYYFWSVIIAFIVSIIYSLVSKKLYKYFNIKIFDMSLIREAISFSFPLMLNSIMWYIVNLGNRYFLIFFIGFSSSGIFAANMRLPLIIVLLYSYVYKALQILIYRNNDENTKPAMNVAFGILFFSVTVLSLFNEEISNLLLDKEYQTLSKWLPLMYLSAIFSSYSSVLGINFMISNNTKKAFISSCYAAIFSVISNLIFIPILGMPGAVISMTLSFLVLVIIRIIMIEKLIISLNGFKLTVSTVLIIGSLVVSITNFNQYIYNALILIPMCILYYSDIKKLKEN